jgi:hypothetical protein
MEVPMSNLDRRGWLNILWVFLAMSWTGLISAPLALQAAQGSSNVKKAQQELKDKGYYQGPIDGLIGPESLSAIRKYQRAEHLPVTGRLDSKTATGLGVSPIMKRKTKPVETKNLKAAETSMKRGGKQFGHAMKQGKPVVAGKDLGKSIGHAGKEVGKAAKKAVQTH